MDCQIASRENEQFARLGRISSGQVVAEKAPKNTIDGFFQHPVKMGRPCRAAPSLFLPLFLKSFCLWVLSEDLLEEDPGPFSAVIPLSHYHPLYEAVPPLIMRTVECMALTPKALIASPYLSMAAIMRFLPIRRKNNIRGPEKQ